MRIINSTSIAIGALATALIFATWQPAEAGKACNRLKLGSPCINSSDLKARINLKESGKDARLRLKNADRDNAVELDGRSGNVTNLFSNDSNESNGLVKAWAKINADGSIAACWRCNTDPNETFRDGDGTYEVDFTPLATDISGRPRLCASDEDFLSRNVCTLADSDDLSSVSVRIWDFGVTDIVDGDFTIMIF